MSIMTWLFGEKPLHEQKLNADESDAIIDHKIEEAQRSVNRVIIQAEIEKSKAQHIVETAEEVLGSLRYHRGMR